MSETAKDRVRCDGCLYFLPNHHSTCFRKTEAAASRLPQQDARPEKHEFAPCVIGGICFGCGRERNDYEYHFEPKAVEESEESWQASEALLRSKPSPDCTCATQCHIDCEDELCQCPHHVKNQTPTAQTKAEEATEAKRPVIRWLHEENKDSTPYFLADEAGPYVDRLEQKVRELLASANSEVTAKDLLAYLYKDCNGYAPFTHKELASAIEFIGRGLEKR